MADPKIAVAGLNPHAGDGGLFGDEEPRWIEPASVAPRGGMLPGHFRLIPYLAKSSETPPSYDDAVSLGDDSVL